ncbi:hypothetical protein [Arcobacter sp. F2176]|uniref:hypothetical protein n=1 Tax=Arcobacter sp. F2176 TaxID=2044511 RepID=UPI00100AB300|nr:hypothetical protein [Arcobacter sp. F2176]RXJ80467.1 hypothetical protein CRU95_10815 [Arcobacter sp. F2176]
MQILHYKPNNTISTKLHSKIEQKLTQEQINLLSNNLFELEETDNLFENYKGVGFGWLEVTPAGEIIDLKYGYLEEDGSAEQNISHLTFKERTMIPLKLDNNNIRFYVNMGSCSLSRF